MRLLSDNFIKNLKSGFLSPLLERVRKDDTLLLAIRKDYINIYYRGGNLLKLSEQHNNTYKAFFDDEGYNTSNNRLPSNPPIIASGQDVQTWLTAFPRLKEIMDFYFTKHPKQEKEFQQATARENNYSPISNETEYFISDIEFTETNIHARFDMVAIRWDAAQRQSGRKCRPAFIEMKFGDHSLKGKSGLLSHLKDMQKLVKDKNAYKDLLKSIKAQFHQINDLDLLKFKARRKKIDFDMESRPEIIFLLANHNPRATDLKKIINDNAFDACDQSGVDLRFFVASFAGYGLHTACMKNLTEFRKLIS